MYNCLKITKGDKMDIQDFESTLKRLDLSKADFAKMVGAVYNGVINWNVRGQTPKWVQSWLENYEKARKFDKIKELLKSV